MEADRVRARRSRRWTAALIVAGAAAVFAASEAGAQAPPDGAHIFTTAGCSGCHGANGEGGVGPELANNPELANSALVVNQILFGGEIMPPFAPQLNDAEVVAVANYIRSSWGNTNTTPTTAEEVAALRATAPASP